MSQIMDHLRRKRLENAEMSQKMDHLRKGIAIFAGKRSRDAPNPVCLSRKYLPQSHG